MNLIERRNQFQSRVDQVRAQHNLTKEDFGLEIGKQRRYYWTVVGNGSVTLYRAMKATNERFPGTFPPDDVAYERELFEERQRQNQARATAAAAICGGEIYPQAHFAAPHPQPKDYGRWAA